MSVLQYPAAQCSGSINNAPKQAYTVTSSFPPGKVRPRGFKPNKIYQRDIQDTMQNATLINIVAAVNVDSHDRNGYKRDYHHESIDSFNVAAITSMMQPRDKTVSIPQPKQRVFNMPEETIRRKPVYYKHSADQEVSRQDSLIRLLEDEAAYRLKVNTVTPVVKRISTARQIVSSLPNKPKIMDNNVTKDYMAIKSIPDKTENGKTKIKSASSQRSRASSGLRRLGQVKATPEPRKVRELPKCDAVDLTQTSLDENSDPAKSALDDSRKLIPAVAPPYIRMESLPVIFPTKTVRSVSQPEPSSFARTQQIYRDRPLSQSLRKCTPSSMYARLMSLPNGFCDNSLTINNGFNKVSDVSNVTPIEKNYSVDRTSVPSSMVSLAKSNRNSNGGHQRTARRSRPRPKNDRHTVDINVNNTKSELHAAVQRVMSGTSTASLARSDRTSLSRKSCLTTASKSAVCQTPVTPNVVPQNSQKKVHFISSSESTPVPSNKGTPVFGGFLIQRPSTSLRAFSPAIQPMSATELLRFQQKILPANLPIEDSVNTFQPSNTGITINGLRTSESAMSGVLDEGESDDNDEELNIDADDQNEIDQMTGEVDLTHVPDDAVDSEQDTLEESDDDFDDYDDDNDKSDASMKNKPEYYKLVKAVDRYTYAGFEHKKMRCSAGSSRGKDSDTTKSHFVKVRLS